MADNKSQIAAFVERIGTELHPDDIETLQRRLRRQTNLFEQVFKKYGGPDSFNEREYLKGPEQMRWTRPAKDLLRDYIYERLTFYPDTDFKWPTPDHAIARTYAMHQPFQRSGRYSRDLNVAAYEAILAGPRAFERRSPALIARMLRQKELAPKAGQKRRAPERE